MEASATVTTLSRTDYKQPHSLVFLQILVIKMKILHWEEVAERHRRVFSVGIDPPLREEMRSGMRWYSPPHLRTYPTLNHVAGVQD